VATSYPNNIDEFVNPNGTDQLSAPSHSEQHANANDAIEALQIKVGVDGSSDTNSLDYRISQLEISPLDTEQIQDAIAQAFASGDQTDITVSYNDALNSLTLLVNQAQTAGYTSQLKHYVKNSTGFTINAGTPVYVSGANGSNMLITPASNSGESTSSKTFGLLAQTLANNAIGFVITEGLLSGINTNGANAGDPVWLGSNGQLIYGLQNKPKAPNHLVFIGVVTRAHAQNGEIFVKVQNGFALEELHNVSLTNVQDGELLKYDSATGLWVNSGEFATIDYVDSALTAVSNSTTTLETLLGLEGNNDLEVYGIENPTTIDSFQKNIWKSVFYKLQVTKNSDVYTSDISVVANGSDIMLSETNIVSSTDSNLFSYTFEENSGFISFRVTPFSGSISVRYYRTAIKA